ncbi:MAG: DUF1611 domain-containing protein [Vulcanococcus sp.]|uniref:DUF1611 domain-containing protein n=1 Tax=Vulcanococcus sp. TaxID=2856995 RepID=UPI003C0387F7
MLRSESPLVLLLHGGLDNLSGKTGLAMLRYRTGPIVAVVDPAHAGQDLQALTGIPRAVPVVADMAAALAYGPEVAVVGLAPSGGRLPVEMRADVLQALRAGLSLASGLHSRLAEDPEFAAVPLQDGQWIWDLRQEPAELEVATARCAALPCRRILAVGSDMAVGKMSACLELQRAALRAGLDSRFVGTGQAGILISGQGVALDAVRVDYAAGAVEAAVLAAAQDAGPQALVLVEGQGSLAHPGSTATLPLMRGSQPTDLLLVHRAGQSHVRTRPGAVPVAIPPLPELISACEALAALGRPDGLRPKVGAIALNTALLDDDSAADAVRRLADQLALPVFDPVRHGADGLLQAFTGCL